MIRHQRTIKNIVTCEGNCNHTGKPIKMILNSAPVNTGVIFVRTDLSNDLVKVVAANSCDSNLY